MPRSWPSGDGFRKPRTEYWAGGTREISTPAPSHATGWPVASGVSRDEIAVTLHWCRP